MLSAIARLVKVVMVTKSHVTSMRQILVAIVAALRYNFQVIYGKTGLDQGIMMATEGNASLSVTATGLIGPFPPQPMLYRTAAGCAGIRSSFV